MEKTNWDLSKIYSDESTFYEDVEKVKGGIKRINELKGDFKANFKEILMASVETAEIMERLYVYSHMKRDEDSRISFGQTIALETEALTNDFNTAISFFRPNLLMLTEEELNKLIADNDLEIYRSYLEKMFRFKPHTLSQEEEYIMGAMSKLEEGPVNSYYLLMNADLVFPRIKSLDNVRLTSANYVNLLKNTNREVREEAFRMMYSTLGRIDNTISSMLYSNINNTALQAKLRKYDSSLQMKLFVDDVDVSVYDNLVEVISEYLPILHDYYRIRKEYLKLDEQHMYDVYLPLTDDFDSKIEYEDAKEIILKALAPLGDEYIETLRKGFEENWIDVYPRDGKRSGAYSWGEYKSDPYVLMNYTNDLDSLFTLAHELGHSMHSYYSRKNNEFVYSSYTIFVAEVASTTNELLLLDYLIKNAKDDAERLYLVNHYVESFKSTVFRQTMFAEFEKATHELLEDDKVLTLDVFNDVYYKLNEKYFGDAVNIDREIQLEWARIPHFYSDFYVYKYATGFSCAVILSQNILSNKENALEKYLDFLKDGGNNYPIDQLKKAGADISKKETIVSAMKVFENQVSELESLLKNR